MTRQNRYWCAARSLLIQSFLLPLLAGCGSNANQEKVASACSDVCAHVATLCSAQHSSPDCASRCESDSTDAQRSCMLAASSCAALDKCTPTDPDMPPPSSTDGGTDKPNPPPASGNPYGYQFTRTTSAAAADELNALRGDWYPKDGIGVWTSGKDNQIFEYGYSFDLPNGAGRAVWWAHDLTSARAGLVRKVSPATSVVQVGVPLSGDLAGFRPMQFSEHNTPDRAEVTILYKRGEELAPPAPDGTRAMRATFMVVLCPDGYTLSDGTQSDIQQCTHDQGQVRTSQIHTRDQFDPL